MLFLFFIYLLSARALPIPAVDEASTSPSCNDYNHCRSLLSIIWSCITTIFLCTWVAVHPNVPEPVDTQEMDFWTKCVHKTSCFFKNKVVMFIYALLVPEYVLAWAIRQRLWARTILKENADLKLTRTHAFFMIMGGFHYFEGSDKTGVAVHPLTHKDVISMLKKENENDKISLPLEEEIQDKSKSDWIAKTIALLQTLWFVTQCIARAIQNLPTTELEIVTLAYTAINIGMFIAWWDKPRNVDRPIRVFHKPVEEDEVETMNWFETIVDPIAGNQDGWISLHKRTKVPMFYSGKPEHKEIFTADGITLAAGVVFGAIHCIAWFFHFRSHTELFLWRISSVAITAVPTLLGLVLVLGYFIRKYEDKRSVFVRTLRVLAIIFAAIPLILTPLLGLLYVVARLSTIVLAFMNLASLPPGAFQAVHWTTLIPHL